MEWYLKCKGIKCDKEGCGWKDDSVTIETMEEWRNKPCPVCGSNLLTDKDWNTIVFTNKFLGSAICKFINWMGRIFGKKPHVYKGTMNGTGKMNLTDEGEING